MQREGYWDYMGRKLREERVMNNPLHLKLNDIEKYKIFTEVDILKKEISQLQESLQNSFIRIKELNSLTKEGKEEKDISQLEFEF